MEANTSNVSDAIELSETASEDDQSESDDEITKKLSGLPCDERPIMLLLKRLIRNKQNTVMTNTQILEILKQEFDIDVKTCHELEVDIYIKIIKKYLKDWPQWEDLERISSKLCNANDFEAVIKVLDHKYKKLKEYLGVMLDAAKHLAKQAVSEVERSSKDDNINSDVVMEVYCTRDQLTQLVYKTPRALFNNNIFNINRIEPTRITLNTLSFESILNYWWTKIYINLPTFVFFRELTYKYKHTLVNRARDDKIPVEVLDTRLFNRFKKVKEYEKPIVFACFEKILNICKKDEHIHQVLDVIFQVLKKDMETAPNIINVPSSYRKYGNRYKYVRYLYVDNDDQEKENSKYDLGLEELMAPTYQFFVGRLAKLPEAPLPSSMDWLKIECMMCKVKFPGSTELMSMMQAHFNDYHQHEPDWMCPNCKKTFTVDYLSKNRWFHEC